MEFNIIEYLYSLINFPLDKAHYKRVAFEQGLQDVTSYDEITEEQRDMCEIALLKLVVYGPYAAASYKEKHGDFERQTTGYTLTSTMLEQMKARLRRLLNKYDLEDDVDELDASGGTLQWINEYD